MSKRKRRPKKKNALNVCYFLLFTLLKLVWWSVSTSVALPLPLPVVGFACVESMFRSFNSWCVESPIPALKVINQVKSDGKDSLGHSLFRVFITSPPLRVDSFRFYANCGWGDWLRIILGRHCQFFLTGRTRYYADVVSVEQRIRLRALQCITWTQKRTFGSGCGQLGCWC